MSIPGWLRLASYAAVVVAVGASTCFYRVNEGMLVFDEAWFSVTTEHMLRTGDFAIPTIGEGGPHLNAAPLYNWLSCLTAEWAGDGPIRYRLWSALFGIASGLAALALGSLLFRPAVGLIAGLLLVTNHDFLFFFGARDAAMNTGLTFCVTLASAFYVRSWSAARPLPSSSSPNVSLREGEAPAEPPTISARQEPRPPGGNSLHAGTRRWWVLVGVSVAGAVLMKPPVFGGFFFCAIVTHHLLTRRDLMLEVRLLGPVVAGLTAALLASPWYAAIYQRLGAEALQQLFIYNSVKRATSLTAFGEQPGEPWYFYCKYLADSDISWGFKVAAPALVLGALAAIRRRSGWGYPVFVTAGFMAALSVSAEKHQWYLLPAYPLLAVLAAAVFLVALPAPITLLSAGWVRRMAAVGGVIAAAVAIQHDFFTVRRAANYHTLGYPPVLLHRATEPDLAADRARIVLYEFPQPGGPLALTRGFSPSERIYAYWLPLACRADSPAELDRLLADGTPTVVFVPPLDPMSDITAALTRKPDSTIEVRSRMYPYPLLLFNGAGPVFRLRDVFGPAVVTP